MLEAFGTEAELIATACPYCLVMLEEGLKTMGLEGKIAVEDIAVLTANTL